MRPLAEKRSIVEEVMCPGAAVARRHGVNANLLFGWRRLYLQGLLDLTVSISATALVPVVMTSPPVTEELTTQKSHRQPPTAFGVIEIELPGGIRLWIRGMAEVAVVRAVCETLAVRC